MKLQLGFVTSPKKGSSLSQSSIRAINWFAGAFAITGLTLGKISMIPFLACVPIFFIVNFFNDNNFRFMDEEEFNESVNQEKGNDND